MYKRLYQPADRKKRLMEVIPKRFKAYTLKKKKKALDFLMIDTCAAVEGQLGGGVELLDEELGQGNSLICVQ